LIPMFRHCHISVIAAAIALTVNTVAPPQPTQRNYDKPPTLIHKTEPLYTSEAQQKGVEGRAVLIVVIDTNGLPTDIKIASPLGMGLDQMAIECVQQWRFKPGTKNGVPVPVTATIEVNFRLRGSTVSPEKFDKLETTRAFYNNGVRELKGTDGPPNYARALESFEKAAKEGFAPAELALAEMYLEGVGVQQDNQLGAEWCLKAAKQGNAGAESLMGVLAAKGQGVAASQDEAIRWYRKAADQNQPAAQCNLGVAYEKGDGVKQDDKEAFRWYKKSAENNLAECQYRLGLMYLDGMGTAKNAVTAMVWFIVAAKQGFEPANIARNGLKAKMTAEDSAQAERLAGQIQAK
jgi:TonB family protein